MGEETCPLCEKPVMGDTALLGHLEFGHDIADPAGYVDQLRNPPRRKRRRDRRAANVAGPPVAARPPTVARSPRSSPAPVAPKPTAPTAAEPALAAPALAAPAPIAPKPTAPKPTAPTATEPALAAPAPKPAAPRPLASRCAAPVLDEASPADDTEAAGSGRRVRRAAAALVVAVLAGGAVVGYQQLAVDDGQDLASQPTAAAADAPADEPVSAPPETAAPTTAAPPVTDAPPATAAPPTTEAPPITSAPTTAAPTTTAVEVASDAEFRRPFLVDGAYEGCEVDGDRAVHAISFRFSGSMNITFDGTFFPDRSGDGPHTTTVGRAPRTTSYLDHVVVVDPAGDEHQVAITPPIYLGGC